MKNSTNTNPFNLFFREKGYIGSIAQKAENNIECNWINPKDLTDENVNRCVSRMYYFTISHAFKNIDNGVFESKYNEKEGTKKPTRFISLMPEYFDRELMDQLKKEIGAIRNICSHYVHKFDKIKLSDTLEAFVPFLKDAFELAVIESCKGDSLSEMDIQDNMIVEFLSNNFAVESCAEKSAFLELTKEQAIEKVLFIDLNEDTPIYIEPTQDLLFIQDKGKYLSFVGCLFLVSLFLYKNEAELLISRIEGFKNNGKEKSAKRNVFTFFAKKASSRDVDNEEKPLVKFRDIIQYLNHYPTAWNDQLSRYTQSDITISLYDKIVEMEIKRLYPEMFVEREVTRDNSSRFLLYAKSKLFKSVYPDGYISEVEQSKEFDTIIKESPKLKGLRKALRELKASKTKNDKNKRDIQFCENQIEEIESVPNPVLKRLKDKIENHLFLQSYGRNQDRFMEFAARFLAESYYFGKDARFKVYQFETIEDQKKYLDEKKDGINKLSKKEYDKLKMHQGRLTCFRSYDELTDISLFDIPFVIENNSMQVLIPSISFGGDESKKYECKYENVLCIIQRPLMIYLLEHALYHQDKKISFESLIAEYCNMRDDLLFGTKQLDEGASLEGNELFKTKRADDGYDVLLRETQSITAEQKNKMNKLLPKRLLNHYLPPASDTSIPSIPSIGLSRLLDETKQQEEKYNRMCDDAARNEMLEIFQQKNKGKQFKLRFVRKVWNLMYFRTSYFKNRQESGDMHHKAFNITRDEFNDFSRWMYAFDEVPEYKGCLSRLFASKNFFDVDDEFNQLFEKGTSLDDFYETTKIRYEKWIKENSHPLSKEKYTWKGYEKMLKSSTRYINLSFFITILKKYSLLNNNEHLEYIAQENIRYLVDNYYLTAKFDRNYVENLEKEESNSYKKLYNKLRTKKLEDALLYEIALNYLQSVNLGSKQARNPVQEIFNSDIPFNVKKNDTVLYKVNIPFNKIDAFEQLVVMNKPTPIDKNDLMKGEYPSLLDELSTYIINVDYKSDFMSEEMQKIKTEFKNENTISFHDLEKLINRLTVNSLHFCSVHLLIEKYYIIEEYFIKKKKKIGKKKFIKVETDSLCSSLSLSLSFDDSSNNYTEMRNSAFHFKVPPLPYGIFMRAIEHAFIISWIKPSNPKTWDDLDFKQQDICDRFMHEIYNKERDDELWYFHKVIMKQIK